MDNWIKLGKEFGLPVLQLAVIYIFIDRRVWPVFEKFLDRMATVSEKNAEQVLHMSTSWLTALSDVKESVIRLGVSFEHVVRAIDDKIAQSSASAPFTEDNHPVRRRSDR